MAGNVVRLLFLADSHLGFDLPARPRVDRPRRGHDFFANYERALQLARERRVHAVVHGGDVFYRSRIPASLVQQAFVPLKRVADAGIPVVVVPGNHERSRIPHDMLALHPRIHVFDRPRTFTLRLGGEVVAFGGFPCERGAVRDRFADLVAHTGVTGSPAGIRLLCIHQAVEGATVGPADFTFRHAEDVVQGGDLPPGVAAVLAGHIHRHQVLERDLRGRPLSTAVFYPGSLERTAFAEIGEPKGVLLLDLEKDGQGGRIAEWEFVELPTRPMIVTDIAAEGLSRVDLEAALRVAVVAAPENAVLRLRITGRLSDAALPVLRAAHVRALAPPAMVVEVHVADRTDGTRAGPDPG